MNDISLYTNDEIESLKGEARRLELEIITTAEEIAEVEKIIHDFGVRHTIELGEIISHLLKIRKERLAGQQDGTETKKREFQSAKEEYEHYHAKYEDTISDNILQLSDEEKKEMKYAYRKATKLCHPDIVADEFKHQAEIIFLKLQNAYENNNLVTVKEILRSLEEDLVFVHRSESTNKAAQLKSEIYALQNKLADLVQMLETLKASESYLTILKIGDWDQYFEETKAKLLYEISELAK